MRYLITPFGANKSCLYRRHLRRKIHERSRQKDPTRSAVVNPDGVVIETESWRETVSSTVTQNPIKQFALLLLLQWNLVCSRAWLKSLTQSTYMGGRIFGALFYGHVSDR